MSIWDQRDAEPKPITAELLNEAAEKNIRRRFVDGVRGRFAEQQRRDWREYRAFIEQQRVRLDPGQVRTEEVDHVPKEPESK